MAMNHAVLIGYANDHVHFIQAMEDQDASQMATREAQEIGKLINAGFPTVAAAIWFRDETKTAGLS